MDSTARPPSGTLQYSMLMQLRHAVIVLLTLVCGAAAAGPPGDRVPWTTSRIVGSPDPPPPYRTERLFPELTFNQPVDLTMAPGSDRWFVVEQGGKVLSFRPGEADASVAIDLASQCATLDRTPEASGVAAVFGIAFHPQLAENRYCYLFYVLRSSKPGVPLSNGTRVSRFTMTAAGVDPPQLLPESEVILIEWLDGGHNGGCLKFGPDGHLYISAGDGEVPSPPDPRKTGQDVSDLLSSILRIDVDRAEGDRPYSIPPDNPFIATPDARPEVWSYGYRNPWRMSFDRVTGELWVGDVGWEAWELVYRVERGGNYGWSIVEGPQSVDPSGIRGPTPIRPPTIAIPHPEAASVTGGFVYRGQSLSDLAGHYIYGDWETRRIWANAIAGPEVGPRREIARSDLRIIAFAEDGAGELYILDHEAGGIHRLVPDDQGSANVDFPRALSETGLFESADRHQLAAGVVSFSIKAQQWVDGAAARRFIAVPGRQSVTIEENTSPLFRGWWTTFPKGSVLGKTFSLAGRPIETQILHFDGRQWQGYSYAWDEQGRDGRLVEASGESRIVSGGQDKQLWRFPSRAQCSVCHNPWARFTLAYTPPQLDTPHSGDQGGQLAALVAAGLAPAQWAEPSNTQPGMTLADPHDESQPLERRARSYLQVNCAHCHQFGGGGTALIDLRAKYHPQRDQDGGRPAHAG